MKILNFPRLLRPRSEMLERFRRYEALQDELADLIAEMQLLEVQMDYTERSSEEKQETPSSTFKFFQKSLTAVAVDLERVCENMKERGTEMRDCWADDLERKLGGEQ